MMKKLFMILVSAVLTANSLTAQEPFPFWNDIRKFNTADSLAFPNSGQILFIGSSSFTMWRDVNEYFPGYQILNRAFGGSTLLDLMRYRYDVIFPYQPRQIVMYCGENDFAGNAQLSPVDVFGRFKALFLQIRARYPKVPFAYVSMKPSPSRRHLMPKFDEANQMIRKYLQTQTSAAFIDAYHAMLQKNGQPKPEIFLKDSLHMNAQGYRIWQKVMKPYLSKREVMRPTLIMK
jgi:lysophospholipase L1-like esterase